MLKQTPQSLSLQAKQLGFQAGDGLDWPRSDWALDIKRDAKSGALTGGDFQAQQLDLALGSQILARLPLAESQRQLIADMKPGGLLQAVQVHWDGPLDAPRAYRAKGQLQGLQLAAAAPEAPANPGSAPPAGRPGVRNASLQFEASDQGGTATVSVADGDVTLPGVFEEATLPLKQAQASLQWRAIRPVAQVGAKRVPTPSLTTPPAPAALSFPAPSRGAAGGRWQNSY